MPSSPRSTQGADSAGSLHEPIAIVGIGCRFPGGIGDARTFWGALLDGVDAIGEIPSSRFDLGRFYDARPATPGKVMTRWGGFLEQIDRFDAYFFGISPREADRLDPQQRLLMEVAWEALEDAGQVPQAQHLRETGVFTGVWLSDYEARLFADPADADFYMTTGSGRYSLSGRLSYLFGFQGPSLTVDTACSSSLVAVHLACQSLRNGECAMALAGGVNVILQPHISIAYSQSKMMAPDGHCKFGDARGDGYVRSEGAGLVVLKRLADAQADGDPIYAVIRGSAVNNDGRSSGFLTTPGTAGQEDLLRKAYANAGVNPGHVHYIEAHGTGTRAGDPVEIEALGNVLAGGRGADQFCRVGSVKTNLGHTEGAAGIAGLIKVALSLKHGILPASLHFETPNPAVDWERSPMRVQAQQTPWPAHSGPAIAGVSAFGIAGTNAHVVLAEAPAAVQPDAGQPAGGEDAAASAARPHLLPLSAHTPEALAALVKAYHGLVTAEDAPALADLCANAALRRTHHAERAAFVAASLPELAAQLGAHEPGPSASGREARKIAFVFSGQGSQWLGMGRSLLAVSPVFREALAACDEALAAHVEWSLLDQLAAEPEQSRLEEISVIQPTLFAVQVALAALWRSWGVEPAAVIGHSMGEVAAAHVAGALSLQEAAQVICVRSRLMQEISGQGAMLVVDLPLAEAQAAIAGYADVSVAVSNSLRSTVLSGSPASLRVLEAGWQAQEVFCRFVKVDVAAHSPQMDPLRPRLEAALAGLHPRSASVPLISTVTTAQQAGESLDAAYWGQNLRQPVLFAAAVQAAQAAGCNTFIEISPHPVLTTAIEQGLGEQGAALASCRRNEDELAALLRSLGDLYSLGYPVDWARVAPAAGRRVSLPAYPWQREHFWYDNIAGFGSGGEGAQGRSGARVHPLLGWEVALAGGEGRRVWENSLNSRDLPLLYQHRVHKTVLLPASALLGMAVAAGRIALRAGVLVVADAVFHRPLLLAESNSDSNTDMSADMSAEMSAEMNSGTPQAATVVQTVLAPQGAGFGVEVYSRTPAGQWALHLSCRLAADDPGATLPSAPLEARIQGLRGEMTGAAYYAALAAAGIAFGELHSVAQVWSGSDEGLARFEGADAQGAGNLLAPPAALDAAFQLTPLAAPRGEDGSFSVFTPARLRELRVSAEDQQPALGHVVAAANGEKLVQAVVVADGAGHMLAQMQGLELVQLGQASASAPADWLHTVAWEPQPLPRKDPTEAPGAPDKPGQWIIFADRSGVGEALAATVRSAGHTVAVVFAGDGPAAAGAQASTLDPASAQEMEALWRRLFPHAQPQCRGVVHLWGLDEGAAEVATAGQLAVQQKAGLASALHLAQAVERRQWAAAPKIWIVTQGAQVGMAAQQASLWGLGRVLGAEHPDIWGGLIDLDGALSPAAAAALLWAEVTADAEAQAGGPDEVALGADGRFVARLHAVAAETPASAPAPTGGLHWRTDGAYLITGGLGGLGALVAHWMVQQGARRLILMGRTPLPPRSEWSSVDPDSAGGRRIGTVRRLEASGATVHLAGVDVGDERQLAAYLAQYASEAWPPIRGVVHAAGAVRDRLLSQLTWAEMDEVLHAKVLGGWLLAKLLPDLHFYLFFSSIGALLGQPGQGNYAAANAFLDALARRLRGEGRTALSINWGPWAGVGFAELAGGQRVTQQLAEQGIAALEPEQGFEVLQRLLAGAAGDSAQVAVLPLTEPAAEAPARPRLLRELQAAGRAKPGLQPGSGPEEQSGGVAEESVRDGLLALEPAQRRARLAGYLQQAAAQVLRMPQGRVGLTTPLGALGLDSLMALELRNRLESTLAISLPATFAWNYPTIHDLAPYIAGRMAIPLSAPEAAPVVELAATPAATAAAGAEDDKLNKLDQLLAGLDALSDESALEMLKARPR